MNETQSGKERGAQRGTDGDIEDRDKDKPFHAGIRVKNNTKRITKETRIYLSIYQ